MPSLVPMSSEPGPGASSQPSEESTNDLRAAQRLPASAVPAITGLRIQGQRATLINISETGLLAECGERQMPGNRLTVMVEGAFAPATMRCRVMRTSVASLGADGRLRYHVGVQFDTRITLEDAAVPAAAATAPPPRPEASPRADVAAAPMAAVSVPAMATSAAVAPEPVRNRW